MKRTPLKRGTSQLKRTPLRKVGKKGKETLKYKDLVKKMDLPKSCEIKLSGCLGSMYLTIAHKHKRSHYKTAEELADIKEIIIACVNCHETIEHNRDLTEGIFDKLRP